MDRSRESGEGVLFHGVFPCSQGEVSVLRAPKDGPEVGRSSRHVAFATLAVSAAVAQSISSAAVEIEGLDGLRVAARMAPFLADRDRSWN